MRTIIAGSRSITDPAVVEAAIQASGFTITEVVCGGARGVDKLGASWAKNHGLRCKWFEPDWVRYGRSAGFVRNQAMADYADALIAVWDGKSRGTADMIRRAEKGGLKVYVHRIGNGEGSLDAA